MRLAMIMCLLLVLMIPTAMAGAACPQNQISAGCWPDATSQLGDAASAQTLAFSPWSAGQPCPDGCYDLRAGVIVAHGYVNPYGGCLGQVLVKDIYTVTGPPGAALTFEAVLQVHAALAPHSGYSASIQSGASYAACSVALDCEATITLSVAPGGSFPLLAAVTAAGDDGAYGFGDAIATGTIRFRGLPQGYSIASCQNYDVPTPAHPSSWGGVKALYR